MKYGVRYVAGGSGVFPLLVGESVAHDAGMYEAGSGWVRGSPVVGYLVREGGGGGGAPPPPPPPQKKKTKTPDTHTHRALGVFV